MNKVSVTLSRKNLLDLLAKLDHNASGGNSQCTIVKADTIHPIYPITGADEVWIKAVEDNEYYVDRNPGIMANLNNLG